MWCHSQKFVLGRREDKKQSAEGFQINRPKATRGREWGGNVPLPSQLVGLAARCRAEPQSKTVLVHIKHSGTPVVEGKLLKIIEKSCKIVCIFLIG